MPSKRGSPRPQARPPRRGLAPRARWTLVAVASLLVAAGLVLARGLLPRGRVENLLLITLDTTRADALRCYGDPRARTPILDRLAEQGCRFERCEACAPLTLPSHCSLFTSTHPYVHGVRRNGFEPLDGAATTLAETLTGAGFSCEAVLGSVVLRSTFGLSQGFSKYVDVDPRGSVNQAAAERRGDDVARLGLDALQRLHGGRFFLWLHFYDPHFPYESDRISDPLSPEAYADEVTFVDTQIGRILEELRRLGLEKKTLIVVAGDHGEGLMDHGESEHGYFLYESTLHVPLLVDGPGVSASNRAIPNLVRIVDVMPTVLDLLDVPAPTTMQGRSLRPLIEGRAQTDELPAYAETHSPNEVFSLGVLRSLTSGGWKYIHAEPPELYHLSSDPQENANLAASEPARTEAMRAELRRLLEQAPPKTAPAGSVTVSEEDAELFRSLGYVGGDPNTGTAAAISLERFDPQGGNPSLHASSIELYARSHRLISDRLWAEAEPILRQVVLELPAAPHPRNDLALALQKLGREAEILDVLADAVRRHPEIASLRLEYAVRLREAGRPADARAQVTEAAHVAPDDPAAQTEYGRLLLTDGKVEEAEARFERALRFDPVRVPALRGLAAIAVRRDSLARAAEYLRRALQVEPRSVQLQKELDAVLAHSPH